MAVSGQTQMAVSGQTQMAVSGQTQMATRGQSPMAADTLPATRALRVIALRLYLLCLRHRPGVFQIYPQPPVSNFHPRAFVDT